MSASLRRDGQAGRATKRFARGHGHTNDSKPGRNRFVKSGGQSRSHGVVVERHEIGQGATISRIVVAYYSEVIGTVGDSLQIVGSRVKQHTSTCGLIGGSKWCSMPEYLKTDGVFAIGRKQPR